jgi:hypothetical protein
MSCGCNSGYDGGVYGGVCDTDTPYPSVSHESVPSLIDNLVNALYGAITKDVSNGKVVWNIPCDPSNIPATINNIPRNAGEGLLCYIIRALNLTTPSGFVTVNGVQTLTNKTLTAPVINTATINTATINNLTATGTLALPAGSITSAMILNGTIVDADINASAAIATSKLAPVTATGSTTARTLANRFSDVANVLDFGAVGNGTDNDTSAFSLAGSSSANVGVYIPAGTYNLATSPTVTGNVTWIFAKGATTTGSGVLSGNIISESNTFAPAWIASSYNGAWSYMPPASIQSNYPKNGNLGYSAMASASTTVAGAATIGFSSAMQNNSSAGSTWCYYGTTLANTTSSNATTCAIELDVSASSTNVGTSIGLAINAGGEAANQIGQGYTFQSVGAAIQIGQNNIGGYSNVNFGKGIYIAPNSIESTFNQAIVLSQNHAIRWFNSSSSIIGSIYCSATTSAQATSINIGQYGTTINNSSNQILLQVNNTSSASNYVNINASVSGGSPAIESKGSDANVDLTLTTKGTGVLNLTNVTTSGTAGTNFGYLPIKINGTLFKILLQNV